MRRALNIANDVPLQYFVFCVLFVPRIIASGAMNHCRQIVVRYAFNVQPIHTSKFKKYGMRERRLFVTGMAFYLGAFLAASICTKAGAGPSDGITLKLYKNQGLFGPPASIFVLNSTSFALPGNTSFSAELVGTVSFPPTGGVYHFACNMTAGTMGYVWVDGHMVCQDNITYKSYGGGATNPLPINTFENLSKGVVKALPFRAHLYYSGPRQKQVCKPSSIGVFDDANHQCGFKSEGVFLNTNSWENAASVCQAANHSVAGVQGSNGQEVWCGNTINPHCPKVVKPAEISPCPGNHSEACGGSGLLEILKLDCKPDPHPAPAPPVGLSVKWARIAPSTIAVNKKSIRFETIPRASLSPSLPEPEARRDILQRTLAVGWGPWLHKNMLAIVKLPEAATITTQLCRKSTGDCITGAVPDGARPRPGDHPGVETRVGLHAYDRSYVQFHLGGDNHNIHANVSVEYSVGGRDNADIDLLITPIAACGSSCADYEVVLVGRYAWLKAGEVSVVPQGSSATLQFNPPGMPPFFVYPTAPANVSEARGVGLVVSLSYGALGFSTSPHPSIPVMKAKMKAAREAELSLLRNAFGPERMGEGQAVKAAAMWTMVSTPAENGGAPFMPVSRVWSFTHKAVNADFAYVIFDWDNFFATLLAACGGSNSSVGGYGGFAFAASNLFQVCHTVRMHGMVWY